MSWQKFAPSEHEKPCFSLPNLRNYKLDSRKGAYEKPRRLIFLRNCCHHNSMIKKDFPIRPRIHDYLFNLDAMTRKEAKHLWRQSIKEAWCNCCAYCGNPPIDDASLTLDHVKPRAKGGEDRPSNCIPACKKCNHSKGSQEWAEWFRSQNSYSMEREYRIRAWMEAEKQNIPISGDVFDCQSFSAAIMQQ